jgi:GNAT superfamily N-acetyltransferase
MNALLFRRATRDDANAIVRLLADDEFGRLRERYEQPLSEAYYEAFARVDADPNNELIVGERGGEVVATLQLTVIPMLSRLGGTRAQIEAVRVDGRFRGQGIGRELIRWALGRARERGCHLAQLTTDKARPDAHRFYVPLGFVPSHTGMKYDLRQQ